MNTKGITDSMCKGCNLYKICSYAVKLDNKDCPCSTCLIKMVCGKSCKDYIDFRANRHKPSYITK